MSSLTTIESGASEIGTRKVQDIDPKWVTINSEGFCHREIVVRLPFGFALDDIKENIWGRVQGSGFLALRKLDRVRLIEYDEAWIAETIVSAATDHGATLAKPHVWQLPSRAEFLFGDELYQIVWVGGGYRVRRKKDNVLVTPFTASKAIAERDLKNLYGRPAA